MGCRDKTLIVSLGDKVVRILDTCNVLLFLIYSWNVFPTFKQCDHPAFNFVMIPIVKQR